jgi:hypothetical protein
MSGFHPEAAVTRWRGLANGAETPRDELNACVDAILAMAAFMAKRGDLVTADRLRQRSADALRALFEEYAAEVEDLVRGTPAAP